jgi:amidase
LSAHPELVEMSAVAVVDLLRRGDVTPHDLLDALEARIAVVDPLVNALPTLVFERAHALADQLMARPAAERGLLAGLPVPIKDLTNVAGVRTTQGSPIFAQAIPETSDVFVDRLEREGGIVYAKSNTPEFGAGANTFNDVFGPTLNPYDVRCSAAGSSGGAAVAVATGMAWVAHGTDLGGSLRSPAAFCNIVGMRPTVGRVAQSRVASVDATLGVQGPMARTVEDLALLLDAMVGEDSRDMLSKPRPSTSFLEMTRRGALPRRVAYSPDLGVTPVEPEIVDITRRAAYRLAEVGIVVEEAHPNLAEAHECFGILRAHGFAMTLGPLLAKHRRLMKPEVVWNVELGLALTSAEIVRAERQRAEMTQRAQSFFLDYDLLLCPATIVAPFPIEDRYVASVNGHAFETYIDWLAIAYAITLIGSPALSLPCGFTGNSLPVGLQMVAPPNADGFLLGAAYTLERILGLHTERPISVGRC